MVKWLLQVTVAVIFLVLLLAIILPWAADSLTRSAQEQFLPSPSATMP
ncbi:MAG TPA: hypothetical protein VGK17_01520 [Propionicimonas sp.]